MSTKPSFKKCVLAVTIAALPLFAESAGLGRLNVLSGLGQPFKGEIELVAVQPGEAESLKVGLAAMEAYTAAQLSYPSPALGLRLLLNKRDNGQMVVQVSSAGAIDEPVFNLLVDLAWTGGRIQREYTALIDPVGYSATPGGASVTPITAASGSRVVVESQPQSVQPKVSSAIRPPKATVRPVRAPKPAASAPETKVAPAPVQGQEAGESYTVKAGDTLSGIAGQVKPEGVSLDQVLVGLYQSNQDAFDGNMNRLKRGKILRVPSTEELASVSKPEAVKEIKAQAANWQNYRRQLAETAVKAPAADTGSASTGGRITAKVEDKGAQAPDKNKDVLKLSRGASKADSQQARVRALEEEATARKKSLDEANQRVAELQKNIKKMEELAALKSKSGADLQKKAEQTKASAPVAPAVPAKVIASAPVAPVVASAPVVAASVAVAVTTASPVAVSQPVEMASAVVTAPASAVATKPKRVVPPPPVVEEPGVVDMLFENALPIGGGLIAVLLGVGGFVWSRSRRRPNVFENSLITSGDLKPNTVLGRTGGGVISTQAENSFLTDFSRQGLGTIDTDEVDPIAEADVYMAYGRDAQAEEILKDALVKDPGRQEIRMKLLDIYVARKDKLAFEEVAADLYSATGGNGQLWEQAVYLGRSIDSDNPLYARPGAGVAVAAASAVAMAGAAVVAEAMTSHEVAPEEEEQQLESFTSALDDESALDFEFEMPEVEAEAGSALDAVLPDISADAGIDSGFDLEATGVEVLAELQAESDSTETEFSLDLDAASILPEVQEEAADEEDLGLMSLDLPIELGEVALQPEVVKPAAIPTPVESTMPSFDAPMLDLPDLDLNLDLAGSPSAEEADAEAQALADFTAQLAGEDQSVFELPTELPVADLDAGVEFGEEKIDLDFGFNAELAAPQAVTPVVDAVMESPIDLDLEMAGGSAEEMDFSADDPVQTKIDLARAYIDMGDVEGAREILQEAEQEGNPVQQSLARSLLADL